MVLSWTVLPGYPGRWVAVILLSMLLPVIRQLFVFQRAELYSRQVAQAAAQVVMNFWTPPFQTAVLADAIGKTLYRSLISKRHLLEWTSSSHIERSSRGNRQVLLGTGAGYALILLFASCRLTAAAGRVDMGRACSLPDLGAGARRRPLAGPARRFRGATAYSAEEEELRGLAKQIWTFYEHFAGAEDHYLPPDNVQIDPPNGVAHRTSPTNIGFLLTSALAAREFGFIGTPELVERLERTIGTVERLDKWNGHLYNWYDTVTLGVFAAVLRIHGGFRELCGQSHDGEAGAGALA
ncbi:hypothetical protein LJK88_42955 [Paenibacillus sp. P26]|nr:hypothetical protein LJK88_42955 [Paenibacillus sp. P26]